MMSKEEVAEIMTYCKEKGISYKSRLAELDIPAWKFYDSKSRYAKEQAAKEQESKAKSIKNKQDNSKVKQTKSKP